MNGGRRGLLAAGLALGAGPLAGCLRLRTRVIEVVNPQDGVRQSCTWLPPARPGGVLVVSPPTWSGTYAQGDRLLPLCDAAGFAYLRPNLRGPNRSPQACLGPSVLTDLAAAVQAVAQLGGPFARRVLVGESGGGYLALGAWLRLPVRFDLVMAWNPISDLERWHGFVRLRHPDFAADIQACTASTTGLNVQSARARSPLHGLAESGTHTRRPPLDLFAGWHDGHQGPVPIHHSLQFFQSVAAVEPGPDCGLTAAEMDKLETRDPSVAGHHARLGDRAVFLHRRCGNVNLTIFDGAHEHLYEHSIRRIRELSGAPG